MRIRAVLVVVLAVLLSAVACAPASAAPPAVYVDAQSAGGHCLDAYPVLINSPSTPWCSLQRAVGAAPEGAAILVRGGGRYPELMLDNVRPADGLTIATYGAGRPSVSGLEVDGGERLIFRGLLFNGPVELRDVQDVELTQSEIALRPKGAPTASGVSIWSGSRVVVDHVFVHDGRHGVALMTSTPPNTDILVADSHFKDLGEDGVHITHHSERVTVSGNEFDDVMPRADVVPDSHADAVQAEAPNADVHIVGNTISGGRGFIFMVPPQYAGLRGVGSLRPVIENNVLAGRQFGIRLISAVSARVVGNTVWGTSSAPLTGVDIREGVAPNARTTGLVLVKNLIKRLDIERGVGIAQIRGNHVLSQNRARVRARH